MSVTSSSNSSALDALGFSNQANTSTSTKNALGQQDFLSLMLAQLKNQSPLEPGASTDFAAQMAQFSSVSSLDQLKTSFQELSNSLISNQTLQASSLVGHNVAVPNSAALVDGSGNPIQGVIVLPNPTTNIQVEIKNSNGVVVNNFSLGSSSEKNIDFSWDGTMANGKPAPAGNYTINAVGNMDGRNATALTVATASKLTGVTLGAGGAGMTLNFANGSSAKFSDIIKIF